MYKFIFLFLILFSSLQSEEELINTFLTSENDNLSLVEGVVNAQNGKLVQFDKDIKIESSDPLELIRYYDGGHDYDGMCGYGIGFSFPTNLKFYEDASGLHLNADQREGSSLPFTITKKQKNYYEGKVKQFYLENGYTNYCEGLLRGEKDLSAMTVKGSSSSSKGSFIVELGNGVKRHYTGADSNYLLRLEERANGNIRFFQYDDKKNPKFLTRVRTTNKNQTLTLNWMNFEYGKKELKVSASNGEEVCYQLDKKSGIRLFKGITGKHIYPVQYDSHVKKEYKNSQVVIPKIRRPDGRLLTFDHDSEERVKSLTLGDLKKPLYTFEYHKNYTVLTDALKNTSRYDFDKNKRIEKITLPHRSHRYVWSKNGQLQSHTVKDTKTAKTLIQEYFYDSVGNIVEAKITGNITQKDSSDAYIVRYRHSSDGRNNLLTENHNYEKEFTYNYSPGTNLLVRKLTYVAGDGFVEREFYDYDENAILIRKIVDDGGTADIDNMTHVTYRLITEIEPQLNCNLAGMTLPKIIKEWYLDPKSGQQHLLKMVEKTYTQGDLLAEEKTYDSNGQYCYSHFFEYNEKKELVREVDYLGYATVYQYDENKNKIFEEKIGTNKKTHYRYDLGNRLIEETETHSDSLTFKTSHVYDAMSNRISTTNHFGQTTTYQYDAPGREISSCDSLGQRDQKEHDAKGNIIKNVDKDGFVTLTSYNLYGKPLEILYPDGTFKRFAYNLQGHLIQEWERDNRSMVYEVDYKGNQKNIKVFGSDGCLKKELHKSYKGEKLVSETDAMGQVTSYEYDGAGRKTSTRQGNQIIYYEYDSLGFLSKTIDAESIKIEIHDFLGRVIEERTEDLFGVIYKKSQMSYDINGNCISTVNFKNATEYVESKTIYNSHNLPVALIDALGNKTTITYRYTDHLEKESIDPMGRKEVSIYDFLNRLYAVHRFTANHELLSCTAFCYDGRNNKTIQQERKIYEGQDCGFYTIIKTYDALSQKTSETEQNEKTTKYIYKNGKLHQTHKPDGVVLTYLYDALGCLQDLLSSDGTIHYRYTYDLNDNLLIVEDLIQNTTTKRSYDALNRLVFEKQATGFEVFYSYDDFDRLIKMQFQGEKISYSYSIAGLISASRYKNEKLLYAFTQQLNWAQKPTCQIFPNNLNINYEWDSLNRCASIKSSPFSQSFIYNAVGNITSSAVIDPQGTYESNFSYDDLNQITKETGHFNHSYAFDSLNNRRNKNGEISTIDDLNRLTSDTVNSYGSDKNGYRTTKNDVHYTYDALGRLISVLLGNDKKISYTYDSFSRRMQRVTDTESVQYLYQFDTEIGSLVNGQMKEFKAIYGQFSPFAIELDDQIYAPIRNHRGDVTLLLDDKEQAVSTYRYDAFGGFSHTGTIKSPWLFSSQRCDDLTKNYHFINREYDPSSGRWLIPDPLGFEDGCNLYAYVHNNPLIYIDPYGLWGESANGYWNQAKEFGHGFSRGFVDDASFGATSCALGKHQTPTFNSKAAYYTGTGCSLATGLVYGGTWAKGVLYGGKALNYGCKALKTAFQSTKSVAQTIKAVKSAVTHTPATKLFQKVHNVGASAT